MAEKPLFSVKPTVSDAIQQTVSPSITYTVSEMPMAPAVKALFEMIADMFPTDVMEAALRLALMARSMPGFVEDEPDQLGPKKKDKPSSQVYARSQLEMFVAHFQSDLIRLKGTQANRIWKAGDEWATKHYDRSRKPTNAERDANAHHRFYKLGQTPEQIRDDLQFPTTKSVMTAIGRVEKKRKSANDI